jgi:chromosome segregation ATPase
VDEIKDITLQVLIDIREEIKGLRKEMDQRFAQMDQRFAQMDQRFARMEERLGRMETELTEIKENIRAIVARFDRDYLVLANEMGDLKARMRVCEDRLGITVQE